MQIPVLDGGQGRVTANATTSSRSNPFMEAISGLLSGGLDEGEILSGKVCVCVWLREHHCCFVHILTGADLFAVKTSLEFVSPAQNVGGCSDSHLLLHLFIIKM